MYRIELMVSFLFVRLKRSQYTTASSRAIKIPRFVNRDEGKRQRLHSGCDIILKRISEFSSFALTELLWQEVEVAVVRIIFSTSYVEIYFIYPHWVRFYVHLILIFIKIVFLFWLFSIIIMYIFFGCLLVEFCSIL